MSSEANGIVSLRLILFKREKFSGQNRTSFYLLSFFPLPPGVLQATFMHLSNHFSQLGNNVTSTGNLPQAFQIPVRLYQPNDSSHSISEVAHRRGSINDLEKSCLDYVQTPQTEPMETETPTACGHQSAPNSQNWATCGNLVWDPEGG